MIRLERILVTQFYLYEAEVVELGEITAMFGPNASGKSSLLDAVQIAMTGGNKNYIALNAQADDDKKSSAKARTIRSYCLGQYGEKNEQRARQNATTYITLIWRNSDTNEPLSMGISIYAHADRDTEEIRGRYVLPGIELSLGDHLESTDRGTVPREWDAFKHQIRERMERINGQGHDPVFKDADRFIRAMLLALRGGGGIPDASLFLRAFRFALRMKFDKSVDGIVREDVLETNDTKIDKFKEVTESFRRLKEMVDGVEEKIKDGEKVVGEYAKAYSESNRLLAWTSLTEKANVEIAREQLEQCIAAKSEAEVALQQCQTHQAATNSQIGLLQSELRRIKTLREGHQAHKNFGVLQATIQTESARAREKSNNLANNLALMRRTLVAAANSRFLVDHAQELKDVAESLHLFKSSIQTLNSDALDKGLRPVFKIIKAAVNALIQQGMDLGARLRLAHREYEIAKDELERAKQGKAPLSGNVKQLKHALENFGLHPRPICDLVRVVDKAWQPVIEAYLGASRVQALLIPDGEEREAFRRYRSMTVYGVKLVMESRQSINRIVEPGSVAELLEGEHLAALAYLRRQFGDLQRADSDAEALAGKRTLTVDGMLVSGGEIDRFELPLLAQCRIGIESREYLSHAIAQVEKCKQDIAGLEAVEKQLSDLRTSLLTLPNDDNAIQYVIGSLVDMQDAQRNADTAMRQMDSAGNEDYVALVNQEQQIELDIVSLSNDRDEGIKAITNAENALNNKIVAENNAQINLTASLEVSRQASAALGEDRDFQVRQWDLLLEKFQSHYANVLEQCRQKENSSRQGMDRAIKAGSLELGRFQQKYRESFDSNISSDWRKTYEWIDNLVNRLKGTLLIEYKTKMEQAYRTSQETFKNDVAVALKERLDALRYRIDELNKVLMKCPPFSNGERYQFSAVIREPLKGLWQFVTNVANHGPEGDLFGGPGNLPIEFEELLRDKAAAGASAKSPLEDYREFYEFDVEIWREDPITKKLTSVGHLSKRIGPGSGGEHRAPLYIIGGAALASAYRLNHIHKNGIRLMVVDEVFNKMDPTNITATMRYLEDLGLQLFMASPGENQGTLNAFLHRYYEVTRDSENNSVMLNGYSIPAEVREIHRADLPEFNPALIDEEVELLKRERMSK